MTIDITSELVERMVALVRGMANGPDYWPIHVNFAPVPTPWDEARAIAALLPETVDPDEAEADAIVKQCGAGGKFGPYVGQHVILAAIKRGRKLAASEAVADAFPETFTTFHPLISTDGNPFWVSVRNCRPMKDGQ